MQQFIQEKIFKTSIFKEIAFFAENWPKSQKTAIISFSPGWKMSTHFENIFEINHS
jgi:hypothetical protein